MQYIERKAAGRAGDKASDARHTRLVTAVLLLLVCTESDAREVVEAWGKPEQLTKKGVSRCNSLCCALLQHRHCTVYTYPLWGAELVAF